MTRIRITPEQIRQASQDFRTQSQNSQQMVTTLTNTMMGMQSEWEGMTSQRFYSEFDQWRTSMNQFVQLLGDISQQLETIAARFEQADTAT